MKREISEAGRLIKKYREQKGLTQEELGGRLNVSASAVAQYENGLRNPKAETLEKYAKALGVPAEYLLQGLMPQKIRGNSDAEVSYILPEKTLQDYTNDELIAEITRRMKEARE